MHRRCLTSWLANRPRKLVLALRGRYRRLRWVGKIDLPWLVLVGTHHKTGTAWLMNIFESVANQLGLKYFYGLQDDLPPQTEIFFQHHSLFDFPSLPHPYRGIHMIRDPRDVIVSGCMYHQKSEEPWLHLYQMEYDGWTYQKKLNSLDSLEEKIFFEMEHAGGRTIKDMLAWNYHQPEFLEIKYEDLIEDSDLLLFQDIFRFLGFPEQSIPAVLEIAYQNSLFSGKLKKSLHLRSGKKDQWKEYFSPDHRERFAVLFGDALIRLGYEKDHAWVKSH
jgi:hypothetical protein